MRFCGLYQALFKLGDFVHSGCMITAEDIARELHITGRQLRGWLRKNITNHAHNDRWVFTRAEAEDVKRRYLAR